MNCPVCYSADIDREGHCQFCGASLTVQQELRLRAELPAPRTRRIQEEHEDLALREGGG